MGKKYNFDTGRSRLEIREKKAELRRSDQACQPSAHGAPLLPPLFPLFPLFPKPSTVAPPPSPSAAGRNKMKPLLFWGNLCKSLQRLPFFQAPRLWSVSPLPWCSFQSKTEFENNTVMESQRYGQEKRKERSSESATSSSNKGLEIEGYPIEGLSIGGQETCVIFPTLKMAFDIGRCPQRAISQDFLFISHGHMDHIGGLPMYVAGRGLYKMKPPTIFIPMSIKENVEKLFEVHRLIDQSELKYNLIGLDVGEEFEIRKDLKVKAFRTYHVIPSQGYIVYFVKQKLKPEYTGLSGIEIKNLRSSGVEVTYAVEAPEIAFTGDTMSNFIVDPHNTDALKARVLVLESTFVDDAITVEHARKFGHTHLAEIANYADWLQNKAILLIHFSARYQSQDIEAAVARLPPAFAGRVFALTGGL